jgi:hypothetical protein
MTALVPDGRQNRHLVGGGQSVAAKRFKKEYVMKVSFVRLG